MTMGKRISALRKKAGLTQEQLAEKLGVSPQAVSKWENDQSCPDISILPELAKILGVTADDLLNGDCTDCDERYEVLDADIEDDYYEEGGRFNLALDKGKIVFPIAVLIFGVELIINFVMNLNISIWELLWTDALTAFGLSMLFGGFSFFSLGVTCIGVYFMLNAFGVPVLPANLGWGIIVAVLIVLWGVTMLIDTLTGKKHKKHISSTAKRKASFSGNVENGVLKYSCSFCDKKVMCYTDMIRGGEITLSFGDMKIDMTRCERATDNAIINATVSFGDLTFHMPKSIKAEVSHNASFGDVKTEGTPADDAVYSVKLNCHVSFGSIKVIYDD